MTTAIAISEQAAPATPVQAFVGHILSGGKRDEIAAALPAHVPFARFERNLSNAVMREPKLLRCDPRVVFREVCKIAALGLVLDPQLGEAYLIVDRNNDVQARIGYRGLIKLAYQSGKVSAIYAHDICEFDKIDISLGTEKTIVHKPNYMAPRGAVGAYYAAVKFADGATDFEPMSLPEIHAIRERSDAWRAFKAGKIRSTPWGTDEGEMSKKTVLRRLLKRIPMSPDLERALAMEDESDEHDRFIDHATGEIRTAPRSLAERMDVLAAGSDEDAVTEQSEQPEPESEVMPSEQSGQHDRQPDTPPRSPESQDAASGADDPSNNADRPAPEQSADEPPPAPGEPSAKALADYDTDLATAAKSGTEALQAAWATVPAGMKRSLKAALDRRHKPTADAADAASAGARQSGEEKQPDPTQEAGPAATSSAPAANQPKDEQPTDPKTADEYIAYARAWFCSVTDAETARARWTAEKKLRNGLNLDPDMRDTLKDELEAKISARTR